MKENNMNAMWMEWIIQLHNANTRNGNKGETRRILTAVIDIVWNVGF